MRYRETKKEKMMPKGSKNNKPQMPEATPSYPSRYKEDKVDSKTMKMVNETYSSRYN